LLKLTAATMIDYAVAVAAGYQQCISASILLAVGFYYRPVTIMDRQVFVSRLHHRYGALDKCVCTTYLGCYVTV